VNLACVPPLTEDSQLREEIPELGKHFLMAVTRNNSDQKRVSAGGMTETLLGGYYAS
jgi:hypothetical protein